MLPNGMTIVKAEQNANNYHCSFFTAKQNKGQLLPPNFSKIRMWNKA